MKNRPAGAGFRPGLGLRLLCRSSCFPFDVFCPFVRLGKNPIFIPSLDLFDLNPIYLIYLIFIAHTEATVRIHPGKAGNRSGTRWQMGNPRSRGPIPYLIVKIAEYSHCR